MSLVYDLSVQRKTLAQGLRAERVTRGFSYQDPDQPWPPATAQQADRHGWCKACGTDVWPFKDLVISTMHYGVIHRHCAVQMRSYTSHEFGRPTPTPLPNVYQQTTSVAFEVFSVTSAPSYPENLHKLAAMLIESDGIGNAPAVQVQRPTTTQDPSTLLIHCPVLNECIGFLPRATAQVLTRYLMLGYRYSGHVSAVKYIPTQDGFELPAAQIQIGQPTWLT